MRAPFISFEGGDGVGKSTQVRRLADALVRQGLSVRVTREPGGAPGAEQLRDLLVKGDVDAFSPMAEALMMYAARAEHLRHTINPARAAGEIVISDRFADSSMAYQGVAGGLGRNVIATLDDVVVGDDAPDLTLILDLPIEEGLGRAKGRGGDDRFERKGDAFHHAVRNAFLEVARLNPSRCRVVDANRPADEVAAAVRDLATPVINSWDARRG